MEDAEEVAFLAVEAAEGFVSDFEEVGVVAVKGCDGLGFDSGTVPRFEKKEKREPWFLPDMLLGKGLGLKGDSEGGVFLLVRGERRDGCLLVSSRKLKLSIVLRNR
jgi:hypothetical protein